MIMRRPIIEAVSFSRSTELSIAQRKAWLRYTMPRALSDTPALPVTPIGQSDTSFDVSVPIQPA